LQTIQQFVEYSLDDGVLGRKNVSTSRKQESNSQEGILSTWNGRVRFSALGDCENGQEPSQAATQLESNHVDVFWNFRGLGNALDELSENGKGLRNNIGLADTSSENSGEDVQDTGVKIIAND
jgi:hypothetical protein